MNFQKSLIAMPRVVFHLISVFGGQFGLEKKWLQLLFYIQNSSDYMMGDRNVELCFRIVLLWNLFQLSNIEAKVILKSRSVL